MKTFFLAPIIAALIVIIGANLLTARFNAEADHVLQSNFNATPMIATPGKQAPHCAECAEWSARFLHDRLVIKYRGKEVTREVVGTRDQMSGRR